MRRRAAGAAHRARPPTVSRLALAAALGFLGGLVVMAAVVARVSPARVTVATDVEIASAATDEHVEAVVRPSSKETPPAVTLPPPDALNRVAISTDPLADLRDRNLTLPVQGDRKSVV